MGSDALKHPFQAVKDGTHVHVIGAARIPPNFPPMAENSHSVDQSSLSSVLLNPLLPSGNILSNVYPLSATALPTLDEAKEFFALGQNPSQSEGVLSLKPGLNSRL